MSETDVWQILDCYDVNEIVVLMWGCEVLLCLFWDPQVNRWTGHLLWWTDHLIIYPDTPTPKSTNCKSSFQPPIFFASTFYLIHQISRNFQKKDIHCGSHKFWFRALQALPSSYCRGHWDPWGPCWGPFRQRLYKKLNFPLKSWIF